MNKLATFSLIAAAALSLAPKPAQAGNKEGAVIGGFIGGLIVGAVISDNAHTTVSYNPPQAYCPPAPVIVDSCSTGYWNDVRVQVYVPGHWAYRYDRGRQVKYYVNGCHEWRTNRVWVANNHNRHDDNRGRQVSSGYGRNNSRNNDHNDRNRDNGGRNDRRNH
jgi:hypothetical protein